MFPFNFQLSGNTILDFVDQNVDSCCVHIFQSVAMGDRRFLWLESSETGEKKKGRINSGFV